MIPLAVIVIEQGSRHVDSSTAWLVGLVAFTAFAWFAGIAGSWGVPDMHASYFSRPASLRLWSSEDANVELLS